MKHSATELRKFRKLVRVLRPHLQGLPVDTETIVVGLLERLWHAAIREARDGRIGDKFDVEDIAEAVGWHGDAQCLVDAFVSTGWLELHDGVLVIHDWLDHCPAFIKGLAARKDWTPPQQLSTELGPELGPELSSEPSPELSRQPSPEVGAQPPNINITKHNTTQENTSAEPSGDAAALVPGLEFDVVKNNGKPWPMPQALLDTLAAAFPDLDVPHEMRQAVAWCATNRQKRKTPQGMPRFLNAWCSRVQNNGHATRGSPGAKDTTAAIDRLFAVRK